jgi:hypothetical protein
MFSVAAGKFSRIRLAICRQPLSCVAHCSDAGRLFMRSSAVGTAQIFLCALRCVASRRAKSGSPGAAAREPAAQGGILFVVFMARLAALACCVRVGLNAKSRPDTCRVGRKCLRNSQFTCGGSNCLPCQKKAIRLFQMPDEL